MNAVISVEQLGKSFGNVRALDGLTLQIPAGGIYGILGPNGAGKSTLFRILLGLIQPTQGRTEIFGFPASHSDALRRIGSMIETPRFPPYMNARTALQWLAIAKGTEGLVDIDQWLEHVGLTEVADRKVRGYSIGMMQRLGIAAALMDRPEVVILDEPTSGMDPVGRHEIQTLVRRLSDKEGVTVIMASHQLADVQKVCDRVAILNRGRLAAEGRVSDLTAGGEYLRLSATPLARIADIVGESGEIHGDAIHVNIERRHTPGLISHLTEQGIAIFEARWEGIDLETVFLHQTAAASEQEAAKDAS